MICGLDDNVKFKAFFSRKELDAEIEFNKACHMAQRNAYLNNKVDVRVDLMFDINVIKSFTPEIKGETK